MALGGDARGCERQHVRFVIQCDVRNLHVDATDQSFVALPCATTVARKAIRQGTGCGQGFGKACAHEIAHTGFPGRVDVCVSILFNECARFQIGGHSQSDGFAGREKLLLPVQDIEITQACAIEASLSGFPDDTRRRIAFCIIGKERMVVHVDV